MLQKLKEAGITAGLRSSNIRVVDPAMIPAAPSRPQQGAQYFAGILVGLSAESGWRSCASTWTTP